MAEDALAERSGMFSRMPPVDWLLLSFTAGCHLLHKFKPVRFAELDARHYFEVPGVDVNHGIAPVAGYRRASSSNGRIRNGEGGQCYFCCRKQRACCGGWERLRANSTTAEVARRLRSGLCRGREGSVKRRKVTLLACRRGRRLLAMATEDE